jgi:eukaryotic-like serine/threonine-protein kinase
MTTRDVPAVTNQQTPQGATPAFEPQPFGKYFLVDKIATGGMAEIFKAKTFSHGGFENLLVIKRILPHIGENQEFVTMFVDEARVSVGLQQPNIVRVYDFGKISENYFIAMECVDGKDIRHVLRKLVRRKQVLPEAYCAFMAHEVCKGLHYAHNKTDIHGNPYGIVHRDISPSNLLVSYEGEVKVADFGIAKAETNAYQTRDGLLKGKFEYMSPEQARGQELDHRSDLFGLGIIMYELLTRQRLFKCESEIATLKKIRDGEIRPPSEIREGVSPGIERICLKALSRDLEDRYASAKDMQDDLREFLFPQTADTIRPEFREFLHRLFAEEMAEERARLEVGSAAAAQQRDRLSTMESWEGSQSQVTMSEVTQTAVRAVFPWVAAIGLGMLGVFAVACVLLLVLIATQGPSLVGASGPPAPAPVVVPGPTGLDVVVFPKAAILLDGEPQGEASTLTLQDVAPGTHLLRLEAEGYEPEEVEVTVEAGQLVKVARQLKAVAGEPSEASAPVPTGPPRISFRSAPLGATVLVDGEQVGRTPVLWTEAEVSGRYQVEMRLEGHQPASSTLRPKPGMQTVSLTLQPMAQPSELTVVMVGGGWANVYVDGKKLGKTAPFKGLEVAPGSHEVRVENPELGLELVQRHDFVAGQPVTIRAAAQ